MAPKLPVFADLVDLADSGETEGRVENTGPNGSARVWFQMPVEVNPDLPAVGVNCPGTVVFASRGTRWTYDVAELRHNERLRAVIKRNAGMRRSRAGSR